MFERKDALEREADKLLEEDTRRRGSGLSSRAPRPAREVLVDEWDPLTTRAASYDEYPSDDTSFELDVNVHSRYLEGLLASALTARQQQCVTLVVLNGMSYRKAGDVLDLAPGTVHDHVSVAIDKLRASMSESRLAALLFPDLLESDDLPDDSDEGGSFWGAFSGF